MLTTKEKSIRVIEFSGHCNYLKCWSHKFLLEEVREVIDMFWKAQLRFQKKIAFQEAKAMANLLDDEEKLINCTNLL